jgi:hypothetical protein
MVHRLGAENNRETNMDKVHHTAPPSRGMEAQQHTTATLGKQPKAKDFSVKVHPAMTDQQVAQDGTRHLIDGAPDASSASPLDTLSASQYGKRISKAPIHPSMAGTPHRDDSDAMMSDAVFSGSTKLPASVTED